MFPLTRAMFHSNISNVHFFFFSVHSIYLQITLQQAQLCAFHLCMSLKKLQGQHIAYKLLSNEDALELHKSCGFSLSTGNKVSTCNHRFLIFYGFSQRHEDGYCVLFLSTHPLSSSKLALRCINELRYSLHNKNNNIDLL